MDLYLYFDEDGALVEHKQFGEVRSGSSGTDNIYIYDKSELADASCSIAYEKSNGDTLEVLATKVYNIALPTSDTEAVANANLTAFEFYKTYPFMYKYTLLDTDLSDTTFLHLTARIFEDADEDGVVDSGELVYAKGVCNITINESVMVGEEKLTRSEYDYLIHYVAKQVEGKISYTDLSNLASDIIPSEASAYNLGSSDYKWRNIHSNGAFVNRIVPSTTDHSVVGGSSNPYENGYFTNIRLNGTDLSTTLDDLQTQITSNDTDIATNTSNIAANETNIATNTSNIAANETNIATNTSNISDILDGTQIVGKALLDSNGDNIHDNAVSLRNDIDRLRGIARSYGQVNYNTEDVTQAILNARVLAIKGANPTNGDLVYDLDNHQWEYNETSALWVDNGEWKQTSIATDTELGVVMASDDVSVNATTGKMTVNNSKKFNGLIGGVGSGAASVEIGAGTASDTYSIAIGYASKASGYQSAALGGYAKAPGSYSIAIGPNAKADGTSSVAIGHSAYCYVPFWVSFDGSVNRTLALNSPSELFFRNENVDTSKTSQGDYTNGKSLQFFIDNIDTNTANIDALDTRVTTNETNISANANDIGTNTANIKALDNRLTLVEALIKPTYYFVESVDTFISRLTAEGQNIIDGSNATINSITGHSEVCSNLFSDDDFNTTYATGDGGFTGAISTNTEIVSMTLPAGTYTWSVYNNMAYPTSVAFGYSINGTWTYNLDITSIGLYTRTFTFTESALISFRIYGNPNGYTLNMKTWLNKGDTALPYEPYYAGIRSATATKITSATHGDNLITNGDFSDGTTGWVSPRGSSTVENNELTFTSNAQSPVAGIYTSATFTFEVGKYYYISADFNLPSINYYAKINAIDIAKPTVANAYETISTIYSVETETTRTAAFYYDMRDLTIGTEFKLKNAKLIDVTDYVNAGKTDEEIAEIIERSDYKTSTFNIPSEIRALPGYGVEGNVVDFENKTFTQNNEVVDNEIVALATPVVTDISAYITSTTYKVWANGTETFDSEVAPTLDSTYFVSRIKEAN